MTWLYVSRKLEFCWVGPAESAASIDLEGRTFHRLTPTLYASLIRASDALDERIRQGQATASDALEYVRQMTTIGEFAAAHLDRDQVEKALRAKSTG